MLRLIPLGLMLLATGASSCITAESECHQRARAMLGCCPSCDEDCSVSKDAGAQFTADSCLADLKQKQDAGKQADFPATEEHEDLTETEESGGSTFGTTW